MSAPLRFYVVVEADVANPVARVFDDLGAADAAAQELAVEHQGQTFVVFRPGEAYRSTKPRAEKVFLMWRATPEATEPPPPPADQGVSF